MRLVPALLAAAGLPGVSGSDFPVVQLDLFRAMTGASAEGFPTEDNDIADVGGVVKYIHTELLTEHLADPLRKRRKYNIDSIRKQRFKIRNPDALLESTPFPDFGQFVTYDWGEATNKAQLPIMEKYGDFVGIQSGCANGNCDPRYPSSIPYNWYSVGNWCPNLPFDKKGSKQSPNPLCLKHDGDYLLGGLCPGGSDHVNVVPSANPTGDPGCVYSYGRPLLVLLDDLVGITREDCAGGVKCKDWLHFRNNCTNDAYRRRFDPITGEVKSSEYCVEYDVHPQCEANCHLPLCRTLRSSGQTVELGLPFWRGRCEPDANRRRLEVTAASFGIVGALDWHQSVDPSMLEPKAPCVHESSPLCKPAPGASGPYCTRSMTGACETCSIPGTKEGPDPAPKPLCPFDILSSVDYADKDAIPPPVCKSKRPRDLCCLYTDSCEAETNLGQVPLDDDGLALVMAEGSTPAMEAFLQRAADQHMINVSALDLITLRRAAYEQWARSPTGATLSEVLASVDAFLRAPPPQFLPAPTTAIVTTTPGTNCFEEGVAFYPLDMEGSAMLSAENPWECQDKCAATKDCAHFSFFFVEGLGGQCHLQDALAARTPLSTGFTSGPSQCWKDVDSATKAKLVVKEGETYLPKELSCLELQTAYDPAMLMLSQQPPSLSGLTMEGAVAECQKYCKSVGGCEHFMLVGPPRSCTLAAAGASKIASPGILSGSLPCGSGDSKVLFQKFAALPDSGGITARPSSWRFAAAGGALLALGALASLARLQLRGAAGSSAYGTPGREGSRGALAREVSRPDEKESYSSLLRSA